MGRSVSGRPATVIIGDHTQGLGVLRSAAVLGRPVWVVGDTHLVLSRFSKYLSGYCRLRRGTLRNLHAPGGARLLLDVLLSLPVTYPSALFGVDEEITRFVHQHREVLGEKYFIPEIPFEKIYDKYVFSTSVVPLAARVETRLGSDPDVVEWAERRRLVLKGRVGSAFKYVTGKKAAVVGGSAELEKIKGLDRLGADEVIAQEVVESDRPVVSICSFCVDGRIRGLFEYEKLRQHPPSFGTGTYLRSVRAPFLQPTAEEILQELRFTGISEIEFIHDRRFDAYKVIEMNPRTWKSIHFATQCGQNLVARYLRWLERGMTETDLDFACDRYWVDLATDLPLMLRELKLPRIRRGAFECTWQRSDPLPAIALWTLFPLLVAEEGIAPRRSPGRLAHSQPSV